MDPLYHRSSLPVKPVRASLLGEVAKGFDPQVQARRLERALEEARVKIADDLWGEFTGLTEDAVPSNYLTVSDPIVSPQWSQLAEDGFGRSRGLADQGSAVAAPRLVRGFDPPGASLESLSQQRREPCESPHRVAEIDLSTSQPIELGRLARGPSALARNQIPEGNQPLEMAVGDGPVDPNRVCDLSCRPILMMYVEVEQDPAPGRILKGADGAIDLC
jgi:hypothetical protein